MEKMNIPIKLNMKTWTICVIFFLFPFPFVFTRIFRSPSRPSHKWRMNNKLTKLKKRKLFTISKVFLFQISGAMVDKNAKNAVFSINQNQPLVRKQKIENWWKWQVADGRARYAIQNIQWIFLPSNKNISFS